MLAPYKYINKIELGIDEAGRGCLAGPVVAAGVILPTNFYHPLLNDSKQVNEHDRNILAEYIKKNCLAFAVGIVDEKIIDEINILQATFLAMHNVINNIDINFDIILIDGNRFKNRTTHEFETIIKGDGKFASIAAASIIAKTTRDSIMKKLDEEFPNYGWKKNKGYGTLNHRKAIHEFGFSKYHRKSFKLKDL